MNGEPFTIENTEGLENRPVKVYLCIGIQPQCHEGWTQ